MVNVKKILFVADAYGSTMSANGACVREVAQIFLQHNYGVHLLVQEDYKAPLEEMIDGFHIHRIKTNFYNKVRLYSIRHSNSTSGKLAYLLQRIMGIRTILLLPWYPLRTPFQCLRFVRCAEWLQKCEKFDLTFCCFNPLYALYVGEHLKKKYGVPFVSYFPDTLTDNLPRHHFLPKKFLDHQGYKYEDHFFMSSDLILNLLCHEKNFQQGKYDIFRNKMKIVDIPLLKKYRIRDEIQPEPEFKNLVYTGSIRKNILQPMLDILSQVDGVKLHLYGSNMIGIPNVDYVKKNGQVSREEALEAQENADILVSMGNKNGSRFIPSKIFEYISTGKPIIHFYTDDLDVTLAYFIKYRNALLINVNNIILENSKKVKKFLEKSYKSNEWAELETDFYMNRAEYTYNVVINNLKDGSH